MFYPPHFFQQTTQLSQMTYSTTPKNIHKVHESAMKLMNLVVLPGKSMASAPAALGPGAAGALEERRLRGPEAGQRRRRGQGGLQGAGAARLGKPPGGLGTLG